VASETVQRISRTRLLQHSNKAVLEAIEQILKDAIRINFPESSDSFLKVNLLLRTIVIPHRRLDDGEDDTSSNAFTNIQDVLRRITLAMITSTLKLKLLQDAEAALESYIELLGYCKATESLQRLGMIGHIGFHKFERYLHMCLERIHREVARGQIPDNSVIHTIGRCFIRLGRLDDLEKHKQQYPNEDWDQLQEEEEDKVKRGEGNCSAAK